MKVVILAEGLELDCLSIQIQFQNQWFRLAANLF